MDNIGKLQKQLELAFAEYMQLDERGQQAAMDMTVLMLRQMLREQSGRQQRLIELKDDATKRGTSSNAEKARNKLARKTSAASPQAPIKTVQITKKNELRK